MRQNGVRDLSPSQQAATTVKPVVGEIVTDRFGARYEVMQVGMKYLSVRAEGGKGEFLLKMVDHIPTGEKVK